MTDLPTHNAEGKQVLGFDNGTSRPHVPGAGAAPAPQAEPPRADKAALDQILADARMIGGKPTLMLPSTFNAYGVIALASIAERRDRQLIEDPRFDEGYDVADWLSAIDNELNEAGRKIDDANLIDKLVDVAATTLAAIERLSQNLDRGQAAGGASGGVGGAADDRDATQQGEA